MAIHSSLGMLTWFAVFCGMHFHISSVGAQEVTAKALPAAPNIVLILADDLGWGEVGCYGQTLIKTPRIDELASRGMTFSQFYAGATVCAPSRCTLMTGRHNGHASVRGNAPAEQSLLQSLQSDDYTVAEMLKERGYDTACVGKWGLGELGEPGHPMEQGFDHFFGYLNQTHAHNYYPGFLFSDRGILTLRNEVVLANPDRGDVGGGYASKKMDYSCDLMMDQALAFMTRPRSNPFFLYLTLTLPHGNNEANRMTGNGAEIPDWSAYDQEDWSLNTKQHAAMVSQLDTYVGRVIDHLQRLGIEDETLIVFTSDNGPHNESKHELEMLEPSGPFRGIKRALYEGGIRVPMICTWPGQIESNVISDHMGYSGDLFQTFADLTGGLVSHEPGPIDSLSMLPTMLPQYGAQLGPQKPHDYLYFEFHEQGSRQSVRFGDWKAIRQPMIDGPVELYDLSKDLGEQTDLAATHPDQVQQAIRFMDEAHQPNDRWPVPSAKVR